MQMPMAEEHYRPGKNVSDSCMLGAVIITHEIFRLQLDVACALTQWRFAFVAWEFYFNPLFELSLDASQRNL
jgi:hypothetical protein